MNSNVNQDIMDKLTKVCVCSSISRATIKKAIQNGAHTLEEVQRATSAGSRGCNGKKCNEKIQNLINEYLSSK